MDIYRSGSNDLYLSRIRIQFVNQNHKTTQQQINLQMKQTLIAALALAAANAQLDKGYEYSFNFDLFVAKEDDLMKPLWMWRHKDGPKVEVNNYDSMYIPNNQVAYLKDMPLDGKDYAY